MGAGGINTIGVLMIKGLPGVRKYQDKELLGIASNAAFKCCFHDIIKLDNC